MYLHKTCARKSSTNYFGNYETLEKFIIVTDRDAHTRARTSVMFVHRFYATLIENNSLYNTTRYINIYLQRTAIKAIICDTPHARTLIKT